jgi:peptidoglycan/LPS O-acetylase OafA/YrhL
MQNPYRTPLGIFKREYLPLLENFSYAKLALFFLSGSFFYINRKKIWLDNKLLFLLFLLCFATYKTDWFLIPFGGFIAYFTLWLSYVPKLRYCSGVGDYSYGLYIYAFPIQQTLKFYFDSIGPIVLFVSATVVTLMMAMLSWHFFEKPILSFKNVHFIKKLKGTLKSVS